MRRRILFVSLLFGWLSAVGWGTANMWSYNHRPGQPADAPQTWPANAAIQRANDRYTLILLAHPKCPCTRATIEELSKLMAQTGGRIATYVLFTRPLGTPESWSDTDLWTSAAAIPGVTVIPDRSGTEAKRFDAHVSGQVLLYDERGSLRFRGGITASRGQIGDNGGRAAIESLVNRGDADLDQTAVFGCPLFDLDSECRKPGHATFNR